ncbi:unnamed protein product [Cyprideis torosa]|uniref:Uncharacterized protein n=1 Tax=Cyprideis torosa TaxID=163714 RepID=A0A7R8WCY8_9CRUS|nr:unnamed protein product [Cyprideis torosa]CAG0892547.1 unnamed protein product [Cyprideis torosa]
MVSASVLWVNKASQETKSEYRAIMNQLYRMYNRNAASVRTLMIANCLGSEEEVTGDCGEEEGLDNSNVHMNGSEESPDVGKWQLKPEILPSSSTEVSNGWILAFVLGGLTIVYLHRSELQPTALPYPDANFEDEGDSSSSEAEQNHRGATAARPSSSEHDAHCTYRCYSSEEDDDKGLQILDSREKYLIFTTGSKTYTPHQIGFKRIRPFAFVHHMDPGPSLSERVAIRRHRAEVEVPSPDWADFEAVRERFDEPDKLIDLQGHIIGMCLSPDQRYLYVNSRPWPKGYVIEDPFRPPPIAQEIDIHVIDMVTLEEVGTMVRAHNSFTPNDECFFIFLDVSDQYVASGSDDKHGYLWDRHYGVCLAKLPHDEVVNSVAICPSDPEVLITASDDRKIKIWRSRRRSRQIFAFFGFEVTGLSSAITAVVAIHVILILFIYKAWIEPSGGAKAQKVD